MVAIGWKDIGDPLQYESRQEIQKKLKEVYPSEHEPSNNFPGPSGNLFTKSSRETSST